MRAPPPDGLRGRRRARGHHLPRRRRPGLGRRALGGSTRRAPSPPTRTSPISATAATTSSTTTSGSSYDPASKRLTGDTTITANATERLRRFNLDLVGPRRLRRSRSTACRPRFHHTGDELIVRPRRPIASAGTVHRPRPLLRATGSGRDPRHPRAERLDLDRRRCADAERARRCAAMVPRERPPNRQGDVHVPRRRAEAARRDRQRRSAVAHRPRRPDHLRLGPDRADGDVPHPARRSVT